MGEKKFESLRDECIEAAKPVARATARAMATYVVRDASPLALKPGADLAAVTEALYELALAAYLEARHLTTSEAFEEHMRGVKPVAETTAG